MPLSAEPETRPRASVIGSFVQGWSRALHAPWVAGGMLAVGFMLHGIDPRVGHETLGAGHSITSWLDLAVGPILRVMTTEAHEIGGQFYIVARSLGGSVDLRLFAFATASVATLLFLSGGVFDRLARNRRVGAGPFFWACGTYMGRLTRLGVLAGAAYWSLSRWLYPQLQLSGFDEAVRDLLYLVAIGVVDVIVLFAGVRTVVEDRRSILGALVASIRFIRRRLVRTALLMLINGGIVLALIAWLFSPGVDVTLLSFSLFLLARVWARLALLGSAIAFFQNELAHAHYTAAPQPTWPDSPAVEAIANLTRRRNA